MYLHIGGSQMIDVRRLIAMFQAHPSRSSKANPLTAYYRPYVLVEGAESGHIRTYVVTEDGVYATPLSLKTLVKRYQDLF